MAEAAVFRAMFVACLILALGHGPMSAEAQDGECAPQISRLIACRPFTVPGAPNPNQECCSALSSISHDCACRTLSIITSLPSRCHISPISCA